MDVKYICISTVSLPYDISSSISGRFSSRGLRAFYDVAHLRLVVVMIINMQQPARMLTNSPELLSPGN